MHKPCLFFLALAFLLSGCWGESVEPDTLPPLTTTGENTFGCRINGEVWTPLGEGFIGLPTNGIRAEYRHPNFLAIQTSNEDVGGGIDFVIIEEPVEIGKYEIISVTDTQESYAHKVSVRGRSPSSICFGDSTSVIGTLNITYFDRRENIVSGTFEFDLIGLSCPDTMIVTEGRFDVKFP